MIEYFGKNWEQVLQRNQLGDVDSIWDLDAGWFEKPNKRRGGWSGVSRIDLKKEKGDSVGVFLKRQENHNTKTLLHPIKGIPTFYQEFKNILCFVAKGIPTVELVYFCCRCKNGKNQAVLITRELEGFESLRSATYSRDGVLMRNRIKREQIMTAVAKSVRKMHEQRYRHNNLYDKHIFVRSDGDECEVRFIDLERSSKSLFKKRVMKSDLSTFSRRISGWGRSDRLRFLKIYMQEAKLSDRSKSIWREIYNRTKAKNKL